MTGHATTGSGAYHRGAHGAASAAPKKSGWELLTDPHFIFTILSLAFSVSVFFYYLYQLLFSKFDDRKEREGTDAAAAGGERKGSEPALTARARAAQLERQVSAAADRLEARKRDDAKAAADAKGKAPKETAPAELETEGRPVADKSPKKQRAVAAASSAADKPNPTKKPAAEAPAQQLRQRKPEKAPKE
jgi:hypothetical protein